MHTSRPSKLGCRSPQFAIRLSLLCSLTISGVRAVPAPAALAKRSMWTSPTTVTFTTATSDTAGQWTSDPPCDSMTTTAACQTTTIFYCPTDTASLTTLASSTASTSWVATSYESSSNVWASATSIAGVHTSVADISIVSLASSTDSIPIWTTTDAPTSTDCWTTVYATSCPCTTTTEDPPCDDTTTSISHTTPTQDPPCDTTTEEPTPTWTDVTLPPCDTTETPSPTAVPSGPSCAAGLVAEDFAFNEIFQNNTPTAVGTTFESSLVVNGTTTGISRGHLAIQNLHGSQTRRRSQLLFRRLHLRQSWYLSTRGHFQPNHRRRARPIVYHWHNRTFLLRQRVRDVPIHVQRDRATSADRRSISCEALCCRWELRRGTWYHNLHFENLTAFSFFFHLQLFYCIYRGKGRFRCIYVLYKHARGGVGAM
ncbi:uncharacterized protein EV422DRAFT_305998 [Fimicolochytrium jonesii]|uniref:uncharacterized protein n=1 Tax=Fimicolochytrium jonesii TaxID=1396493 RepID=UPI0022FE787D|nr:uncharacterized protein EV422DRAFT_305998 [Fimicolochytrium jonesii]KAI8824086.1 hypothetical protein EV422DRAFT_305998 [Fimicolochytrium jonesii]